jgi:hypothetical protein
MTATYTFDIFCSLDGYGSYKAPGDWGGYWGKQGPELLGRRLAVYGAEQRMVFRGERSGPSWRCWPQCRAARKCLIHGSPG